MFHVMFHVRRGEKKLSLVGVGRSCHMCRMARPNEYMQTGIGENLPIVLNLCHRSPLHVSAPSWQSNGRNDAQLSLPRDDRVYYEYHTCVVNVCTFVD